MTSRRDSGYVRFTPGNGRCRSHQSSSVLCHVWTAPCWQELSARLVRSEQPCVRPVDAARMTAGHNAFRGSGPGQKLALDSAVAQVGCPDLRIDRICVTCCSSFQPSHHADDRRDLVTPPVPQVPCSARPWPSLPRPCARFYLLGRWLPPWSAVEPIVL